MHAPQKRPWGEAEFNLCPAVGGPGQAGVMGESIGTNGRPNVHGGTCDEHLHSQLPGLSISRFR
jgi:hypothetical protein